MKSPRFTQPQRWLLPRAALLGLLYLVPLTPVAHAQSGGGYELKNAAFTSGSDASTNGAYRLSGTFSPSFPGPATNGGLSLTGDFVTLGLLADAAGPDCVPPPPGLVNWWTFDEQAGASAHDIAGGKDNLGNLSPAGSSLPSHVAGKVKNALSFNGTNFVRPCGTRSNFMERRCGFVEGVRLKVAARPPTAFPRGARR